MANKKVLMLHGYSQNAIIFSKRMGALRKACKGIELVFVDAPNILQPADLVGFNLDSLGAGEANTENAEPDPSTIPRGWWRHNPEKNTYVGVLESISLLRDILAKDKYEGVFGFSQGASMAALIAAILEKPELHPSFLVEGEAPHPPLSFCISASGFKPKDTLFSTFFEPSFNTPTLHVIGLNDVIVPAERSQTLIDVSANRRVVAHDGGHFIPSKAPWRNFLRDFLRNPVPLDAVSPPPSSDEANGKATSLTATPVVSAPVSGRASPDEGNPTPSES
ncbi:ovarian cancer-associated 2 [Pyrrhoderma noxium]|uniref:Ovarian cancer-associated 2 n=1 Tax=Pyrrhoderma noxium TaxID=2282107 RepID=A0A286UXF4_9AGAM|nr:ovarian cancer-associated 2 [Pyrrhoderma noxium]